MPPRGMVFIGAGNFMEQGRHLLGLVITYAGLEPEGRILDIGCGIGRLAAPLTGYLATNGRYEGFDIVKQGIKWCNKKIAPHFPNFHFLHVDLKNGLYNLGVDEEAKNFVFPYPKNYFDCVVLTSVFTHMVPDDVDNYLGQIASVMKDGGKCLATFFLLNPETKKQIEEGKTGFKFLHIYNGYSLMDKRVKEANIAFEETYLLFLLAENGLCAQSIYRCSWANGTSPLDFQDVVVIVKQGKEG